MSDLEVLVLGPGRVLKGRVEDYTALTCTPRYCDVGTFSMTVPWDSPSGQLFTLSAPFTDRLVIRRRSDAKVIMSGPVNRPAVARGGNDPAFALTVGGVSDEVWLAAREARPLPTAAIGSQTDAYDVTPATTVAETALRHYVNTNAGPGALSARQVAGLVLEAVDGAKGTANAFSARFDNLLELLQRIALAGGVGFRVRQDPNVGAQLLFSVYAPVDRRASLRFSWANNNLLASTYEVLAPTVNAAVSAGGGDGTARIFREVVGTTVGDWGRFEQFIDQRQTTVVAELDTAAQTAITAGDAQAYVTFTPLDAPGYRYGADYDLGDLVTIEPVPGLTVVDRVREVLITDTPGVTRYEPRVGGPDASATPNIYRAHRKLAAAVGLLSKRK